MGSELSVRSAFIHPSQAFMWEHIPNYQRLEFLGDSLLDQAFIMHLVGDGIMAPAYPGMLILR